MGLKTKYNLRRKVIRMSWNKYNILILKRTYRVFKKYQYKKRKTGIGRGFYVKFFAKCLLKKYYGDIKEKSLRKILKKSKIKNFNNKNKILNFFILLESRLDIILFRMNFATSIYASRQLITHGHVLVNNKVIRGSNYYLKENDIIKIKNKSINFVKSILKIDKENIKFQLLRKYKYLTLPKNLIVNYRTLTGIYLNHIKIKDMRYPFNFNKIDLIRYYL